MARMFRRPMAPEHHEHIRAEATEAIDLYSRRGWLDNPVSYFPDPPPAAPEIHQTRLLGGLSFERFRFESGYDPDPEEPTGVTRCAGDMTKTRFNCAVCRDTQRQERSRLLSRSRSTCQIAPIAAFGRNQSPDGRFASVPSRGRPKSAS